MPKSVCHEITVGPRRPPALGARRPPALAPARPPTAAAAADRRPPGRPSVTPKDDFGKSINFFGMLRLFKCKWFETDL